MLAGLLAGPTLLIAGKQPWTGLSVYISLRAALLVGRVLDKMDTPWARAVTTVRRFPHCETAIMSLSSAQILYSYFLAPNTLPRSYIAFLDRHVGKPRHVVDAVTELMKRNATALARGGDVPFAPLDAMAAAGTVAASTPHVVPQTIYRPSGQGSLMHFVKFLQAGVPRAIPVYLPVYLVPFVLVHRKRLMTRRALPLVSKMLQGVGRSSLFLASYCALAWVGVDAIMPLLPRRRVAGTTRTSPVFIGAAIAAGPGTLAGLATLLEKPSRRSELALYCASRAVESYAMCLNSWGYVRGDLWRRYRLDVALFSLSTAVIMGCYSAERDVFRSKYLSVIDWLFGNVGFTSCRIRHIPSVLSFGDLRAADNSEDP